MGSKQIKAYILVLIQVICMVLILATGRPLADALPLLLIELAGIALGGWAMVVMRWWNLHASPLVHREAELMTGGPYRLIRHPMYTALLLAAWSLIIDQFTPLRLATGLVLTADLIVKLLYEEGLLKSHFPEYAGYMKRTKRIIPYLL